MKHFVLASRSLSVEVDEPSHIPGVSVRQFNVQADLQAALRAYNEAFEGQPHLVDAHRPERPGDWKEWMESPPIRPELSWVAESLEEPGRIVGFCICAILADPVGPCLVADRGRGKCVEGWVDLLGTSPEWRGRGLGKSLLLHCLRSMRAAGLDYAVLGVDPENHTRAGYVYASAGFMVPGLPAQGDGPARSEEPVTAADLPVQLNVERLLSVIAPD